MATLGATAVIAGLDQCAVGSVAAWAHGCGDRLHIGAGFRVDPAGQPRHPIRTLLPQCQAPPAGTVFFVEIPVWVEDLIDTAGDGFDDLGIVLGGFAHEAALHLVAICDRHTRRQQVDGPADHPQMILTDFTGLHRGGDMRQRRRQRWAGQLPSRSDARGHLHPAFDLSGRDTQPPGQVVHHRRHHHGLIGRIGDLTEHPIHQPRGWCAPGSRAVRPSPPGTRCPPHHWTGSASRRKRTPPDRTPRETARAPPAQSRIQPYPNAIHHRRQTSQPKSDPHRICG